MRVSIRRKMPMNLQDFRTKSFLFEGTHPDEISGFFVDEGWANGTGMDDGQTS
jgi:hypothetical protein